MTTVPEFTAELALATRHGPSTGAQQQLREPRVEPAMFGCGLLATYCVDSVLATEVTGGLGAPSLLTCLAYFARCGGAAGLPFGPTRPATNWA